MDCQPHQTMPPISKKRKVYIASTVKACQARKTQRVPNDYSDIQLHIDHDSEEEDSELRVEEELVIEGDALAHLMAIASRDLDSLASEEPNFKYQRGVRQSRKALYLARKKQADLQYAAANTVKIMEFFTSKATVNTDPINTDSVTCNQLQLAIDDLKALLHSKRVPIGQNFNRHNTVLLFLQLQLRKPQESQKSLSLLLAEACSCSEKMARRIRTWTDSWISSRYIRVGMRSNFSKVSSWLTDKGVLLTIREYIAAVGEKLTSHRLAKAVNEYLKEENIIGGAEDWKHSISERTARIWLNTLGFQ
ncbi:hypothetical protein BGX38DRAFT_1290076 [Terfezia claveryi]|nr:hypothetical protein BGX38DRAFT_1290076 [Terfezia claveryi]